MCLLMKDWKILANYFPVDPAAGDLMHVPNLLRAGAARHLIEGDKLP